MPLTPPSPISTAELQIRIVQEDDLSDLFAVNSDDEVTRFLPYPSWQSIEDGEAWYQRMCDLHATGTGLQFVISHTASACVIGSCLLFRLEEESARAEIGYVMGRKYWNKGHTYEALTGLINYAFTSCALRRLEAEIDSDNLASNNLIAKLGFIHEGLLRQRWTSKGRNKDTNIYGLLREEDSSQ